MIWKKSMHQSIVRHKTEELSSSQCSITKGRLEGCWGWTNFTEADASKVSSVILFTKDYRFTNNGVYFTNVNVSILEYT